MASAGTAASRPAGPALRQVCLEHVPAQPWRNGGGLTHELLAWRGPGGPDASGQSGPAGAGHAVSPSWTLRVSVADITRDGPFSAFAGVSRVFAVLEGAGVVLSWPGVERRLSPTEEPLVFDGADAPGCRLVDGPTRDLNLMVRQGAGRPRMSIARPGERWTEGEHGLAWRGLYAHGAASVRTPWGPVELGSGTLLWSDDAQAGAWTLVEGGPAWWLGLDVARGAPP